MFRLFLIVSSFNSIQFLTRSVKSGEVDFWHEGTVCDLCSAQGRVFSIHRSQKATTKVSFVKIVVDWLEWTLCNLLQDIHKNPGGNFLLSILHFKLAYSLVNYTCTECGIPSFHIHE